MIYSLVRPSVRPAWQCYVDRSLRPCVHRPPPPRVGRSLPAFQRRRPAPRFAEPPPPPTTTDGKLHARAARRPFERARRPPLPHSPRLPFLLPSFHQRQRRRQQRGWNERDLSPRSAVDEDSAPAGRQCGVSAWQLRLNYARHRSIDRNSATSCVRPQHAHDNNPRTLYYC